MLCISFALFASQRFNMISVASCRIMKNNPQRIPHS